MFLNIPPRLIQWDDAPRSPLRVAVNRVAVNVHAFSIGSGSSWATNSVSTVRRRILQLGFGAVVRGFKSVCGELGVEDVVGEQLKTKSSFEDCFSSDCCRIVQD